jgi:hypothetical protein
MRRSSLFVVAVAVVIVACSTASSNFGNTEDGGGSGSSGGSSGGSGGASGGSSGGSGGSSGGSSGSSSGSSFPIAAHPAFPQLVDQGGPVLTAPKIVTVTFPGDANATTYNSFGAQAVNNSWWDTVRAGYCETGTTTCVGDGPGGTSIAVTAAPGSSYTDSADPTAASTLKTYIQSLIPTPIPTPDAQTMLVFYFPASTTITLDGASSCQQFGGYHNSLTVGGVNFTYAIVNECPVQAESALTQVQETTFAASHEIVEAATDPFQTQTALGFYLNFNDPAIVPWNNSGGGEAADMCVDFLGLNQDSTTEGGFTVQRIWNNAAAAAGGDPCVPASTAPYYNTAPEKWLETLAVGSSGTFGAVGFSNATVANWTLLGYDLNATSATNLNPYLSFTFNGSAASASMNNGTNVQVTVKLNQDPANLQNYSQALGATGFLLSLNNATPSKATSGHFWPILVTTPTDADDAGFGGADAAEDMPRRPNLHITHEQWANFRRIFPNLKLD